jgi:hypothetical protein
LSSAGDGCTAPGAAAFNPVSVKVNALVREEGLKGLRDPPLDGLEGESRERRGERDANAADGREVGG